MDYEFAHERLDCYRLAVEVNRWFSKAVFPPGRAHLKDQGQRASDSVVCNIAEGASKRGTKAGRNNLRIALFRSVTQRADRNRQRPWRSLMRQIYLALVAATATQLAGIRRHLIPPVPD